MKKIIAIILTIIVIILGIVFIVARNNQVQPEKDLENTIIENIPTKEIPSGIKYDEDGLEVEGFEWSNPNMISGNTGDDEKFIVGAKQSQPVYYSQVDSRWRNHPYTITGNSSQTIGTSGCGPTCAAMIVSTIKGTIIPPDMGDLFIRNGFRTVNNGTYHSAFPWVANYFGIEMERVYSTYDMAAKVKNGYIAVVSCGEGLWTTGGHFITVMGNDNGILKVFDPYLYNGKFNTSSRRRAEVRVEGNTAYITVDNFYRYSNASNFWCYKYKNETKPTPTPDPTPTPTPSINTKVMYVIANSGLNVRSGPGTNYRIVTGLSKGTQVTVYEESNGWSRIGNNQWVSSQYLSTTKTEGTIIPESNTYQSWTGIVTAKSGLNIRKGPGTNYQRVGLYSYNTKITIIGDTNGWYETNKGYVSSQYVSKVSTSSNITSGYSLGRYKVNVSSILNVRSGPGTNYRIKKTYNNGTVFDTYEIRGDWARTPSGWVNLKYATLMYKY